MKNASFDNWGSYSYLSLQKDTVILQVFVLVVVKEQKTEDSEQEEDGAPSLQREKDEKFHTIKNQLMTSNL